MEIIVKGETFLIDDEDFDLVSKYTWRLHLNGYAQTALYKYKGGKNKTVLMHRMIMGVIDNNKQMIDHINRNPRDNRKENLRFCTHIENCRNSGKRRRGTSEYLGVFVHTVHKKYKHIKVCIRFENRNIVVGPFDTQLEAAIAYNELAKKYFGEFANLNQV